MNNMTQIDVSPDVESPPAPRKLPQQGRSKILFDSIKQACLKILVDDGPQALTAVHLADVAGVCVGSIYQYFPNIDAVVAAVFGDEIERAVREIRSFRLSVAATLRLEEQIRYMIDACIAFHQWMLSLDAAFYQRYVDTYSPTNWFNQSEHNHDAAMQELYKVLVYHEESRGIRDARTKAFVITSAHRAILVEAVKHHPEMLANKQFADYLFQLALGVIFESSGRSGEFSADWMRHGNATPLPLVLRSARILN